MFSSVGFINPLGVNLKWIAQLIDETNGSKQPNVFQL